jgi:hypothetical protein
MVRFEYEMTASDGLGYADSEPGKLIYLLSEPWHVSLQKLSLDDLLAASGDGRPGRGGWQLLSG